MFCFDERILLVMVSFHPSSGRNWGDVIFGVQFSSFLDHSFGCHCMEWSCFWTEFSFLHTVAVCFTPRDQGRLAGEPKLPAHTVSDADFS